MQSVFDFSSICTICCGARVLHPSIIDLLDEADVVEWGAGKDVRVAPCQHGSLVAFVVVDDDDDVDHRAAQPAMAINFINGKSAYLHARFARV